MGKERAPECLSARARPCETPALNIPGIYSPPPNSFPFLSCGDTAMTFPNVAHDCLQHTRSFECQAVSRRRRAS